MATSTGHGARPVFSSPSYRVDLRPPRFHGRSITRHSQQQELRSPDRFPNRIGSLKWIPFDSSSTEWAWTATAMSRWTQLWLTSNGTAIRRLPGSSRGCRTPRRGCSGSIDRLLWPIDEAAFLERALLHFSWPPCLRAGPSPDRARCLSGSGPLPRTSGSRPALGSSTKKRPG